jgi:hypothetical protein
LIESNILLWNTVRDSKLKLFTDERGEIRFGERRLDLSSRPLSRSVFEILMREPANSIDRWELVEKIYGPVSKKSDRLAKSVTQNTVKLISRCRRLAESAFGTQIGQMRIRWFPFDEQWQGYKLYEAFFVPVAEVERDGRP